MTTEKVEELVQRKEVCQSLGNQPDTFKCVREHILKGQQRISKTETLHQGQDDTFKVGDVVLKINIREQQRERG